MINPCHDNNNKSICSIIKAIKWDSSGVSPLKENGELLAKTPEKANALNILFLSVFTSETSKLPAKSLENIFYPTIDRTSILLKRKLKNY